MVVMASPEESRCSLKKMALVASLSIIVISSFIVADVFIAGYEYDFPEPTFYHTFPDTILFSNISDGVTANIFSFILILPANHTGHHRIVPREISLIFWFKDVTTEQDTSIFIPDVLENRKNSTCIIDDYDYDRIGKSDNGWWAPSSLFVAVNEEPDANFVRFGLEFELMLINDIGNAFDGHDLNVRLDVNVTYSRWWFGLKVDQSHQIVEYVFDLPDDGITRIQSFEWGI